MFGIELWVITGLVSVIFKSSYQSLQKPLNQEYNSLSLTQSSFGLGTVLFSVVSLVVWLVFEPGFESFSYLLFPALAGLFIGLGAYCFNMSMRTTDLSIASPLQQTIPVFAAVIEPFVLSELGFEPEVVAAAVVATIGAYVISIERGNLLLPIKNLTNKGPLLAITAAVLYGCASVVSHFGTQTVPVPYYVLVEIATGFVLLSVIQGSRPQFDRSLVTYGFLFNLTLGFDILTLSLVVASKATVLFRLSLILNVIIGVVVFGEENAFIRIVGALIIISGVVLSIL